MKITTSVVVISGIDVIAASIIISIIVKIISIIIVALIVVVIVINVVVVVVVLSLSIGVVAGLVAGVVLVWILGFALVPDVRVEARAPVGCVGNDLCAAVWKLDSVLTAHRLSVAGLATAEVIARGCVLHSVAELVRFGLNEEKDVQVSL